MISFVSVLQSPPEVSPGRPRESHCIAGQVRAGTGTSPAVWRRAAPERRRGPDRRTGAAGAAVGCVSPR